MLLLDEKKKSEIFTQLDIDPENNFKILKPLGEGAYGAVFKASDGRDDQLVALKVMRFDPDECQDLLSEIRILRDCSNEYIVNFKDTFYKDGNIWLAMEFCQGGSALDIIKVSKHTLSEKQCQCVLYHSLKGLAYLHSKNLIHRDIKAANILINSDGKCKLADFGVARSMRASGAGTTIGSPYWMAPEVLGTEKYDNSADIWSLGIAAIEMVIGKPPLANHKPLQAMFMIPKNDPPTIPEEYIDDFSQEFIDFLAKCLKKNPSSRPTAKQLLQDPFIKNVSDENYVENILQPFIEKLMPLIEKDRDLKARMANDSYDESKWSEYTQSLQRLSRDGSMRDGSMVINATMVKNGGAGDYNDGTLKIVKDDAEDDNYDGGTMNTRNTINTRHTNDISQDQYDPYGDNGGTLVRKITPEKDDDPYGDGNMTIKINSQHGDPEEEEEEEEFDGGTMITIKTKDDDGNSGDDEEEDEYHENGFSPSSHNAPNQQHSFNHEEHEKSNSMLTTVTNTTNNTATTKSTNLTNNTNKNKINNNDNNNNEDIFKKKQSDQLHDPKQDRGHVGGGYSIGSKKTYSIGDADTMVRATSTDEEDEDPFQGQTMYRAPTVDSPRANLVDRVSDNYGMINTDVEEDNDQDQDESVIMSPPEPPTTTTTTTNTTSTTTMNKQREKKKNEIVRGGSDDEETYELNSGYENKPRSPVSHEPSFVCL